MDKLLYVLEGILTVLCLALGDNSNNKGSKFYRGKTLMKRAEFQ